MTDTPRPRRFDSADTVPINADELRQRLRELHGPEVDADYVPVPDDENPTAPDLLADKACVRCKGTGKAVETRPDGSYHGPVTCPRCKGLRLDPEPHAAPPSED